MTRWRVEYFDGVSMRVDFIEADAWYVKHSDRDRTAIMYFANAKSKDSVNQSNTVVHYLLAHVRKWEQLR